MKEKLKHIPMLKYTVMTWRSFRSERDFFTRMKCLYSFFKNYHEFRKLVENPNYKLSSADLFPRIYDKTNGHKLDPVYFLQGTWCAKKIFDKKPIIHHDIGSQALMVGIISQSVPTTMIDIRPLEISLPGLTFIKGDITKLPFQDKSILSLSSICVIEHIGLGRYGDPLDQFGTEKAAKELARVLAKDGSLYISVPVDRENKIYFNAHRAFTRDYVIKLFSDLALSEEKYIYGKDMYSSYDITKGFGTGLYHFKKI
jgi:SAM-dependent methyltransferase